MIQNCPNCNASIPESRDTCRTYYPCFENADDISMTPGSDYHESCIEMRFIKCPECHKYIVLANGKGSSVQGVKRTIYPVSLARKYPDYIPRSIRSDYEEAYAICELSPKASATLSRRCLQGMIRDFWGISKPRLYDEIAALEDKVPALQWKVLNAIRKIGNIGAHPDADVNLILDIEPCDAQKLLLVIETLMKHWYIDRHEEQELYSNVLSVDSELQTQRAKE